MDPVERDRVYAQVDRAVSEAFEAWLKLLRHDRTSGALQLHRLFSLMSLSFADRVRVGNASQFLVWYARAEGYDIPPYPLSTSGEIRQFFKDEGVSDVPGWYAKIGFTPEEYATLHEHALVSVRRADGDRAAILLRDYVPNQPDFVSLGASGLERLLAPDALARLLERIAAEALGESHDRTCADAVRTLNPSVFLSRFF